MDWDLYNSLLTVKGDTRRERAIFETKNSIKKRAVRSPAYKQVLIDGEERNLIVTASTELFYKKISTMPDEHIYCGQTVLWNNTYWLITHTDTEDEVYQRGLMYKCNVCLKWQDEAGKIHVKYGYSEDVSQFAAGVVEAKILNSLQFVLKIKIPLDKDTVKIRRDKRFLIDVVTDEPNAYIVTQRNVITENFHPQDIREGYEFDGKDKILFLTLSQTQLSEKDNTQLMIADYFKPKDDIDTPDGSIIECSITYKNEPKVKAGGGYKTFNAVFKDTDGNIIKNIKPIWSVKVIPEFEKYFDIIVDNNDVLKIKAEDTTDIVGSYIEISLKDKEEKYNSSLKVKVVNLIYG